MLRCRAACSPASRSSLTCKNSFRTNVRVTDMSNTHVVCLPTRFSFLHLFSFLLSLSLSPSLSLSRTINTLPVVGRHLPLQKPSFRPLHVKLLSCDKLTTPLTLTTPSLSPKYTHTHTHTRTHTMHTQWPFKQPDYFAAERPVHRPHGSADNVRTPFAQTFA